MPRSGRRSASIRWPRSKMRDCSYRKTRKRRSRRSIGRCRTRNWRSGPVTSFEMGGSEPPGYRIDRRAVLGAVPGLSDLPEPALHALAASVLEERHAAGAVVVAEGDVGDRFYVVVRGTAMVTAQQVPLANLGPTDTFGEIALLSPAARRSATVTALTDLFLLALRAADFRILLEQHPALRQDLESSARRLLRLRFLTLSTPFSGVGQRALARLAEQAEDLRVAAGDTLIRAGEPGDAAYCVVSGRLQVLREGKPVAQLEAGALFGEAALLT